MIPRNLVPDSLYDQTFIAGGFAACPSLATDMDVWIFVDGGLANLEDARRQVLEHLQAHFDISEEEGGTIRDYRGVCVNILKVAFVQGFTLPIHVMVCDAPCGIILRNFDISTHQVALTTQGVVKGDYWTPVTEPPVVIDGMENEHTAERLDRIRRRYSVLREEVAVGEDA